MLRIRKLDIFVLKSFGLLFAGTFFICLFIFMMQFLWRYVDDMVGKGLEMSVLVQFFFYAAMTLVPASLPLAVLLASLITFGNFGERFELLAMKAAGISLMKIMRPLIVFLCFICCLSFYFQNVIGPVAQTKLWTLLISMKQKSPELDIPEQAFYDQIDGYNLYVGHKDRETGLLQNIMIYNFANGFENAQIIKADSGRMEMSDDKQHLFLRLYSGEQFENLQQQNTRQQNVPYRRESFREKHAIIDFNANFDLIDEGFMTTQSNSKNMSVLQESIDSMRILVDSMGRYNYKTITASTYRTNYADNHTDSLKLQAADSRDFNPDSIMKTYSLSDQQRFYTEALNDANAAQSDWSFKNMNITQTLTSMHKHETAWHEKITLSLACLIFFFIGAPLGGIIRKGGLGMPVVISVLIFIFYYIVNNTGYKLARDGQWSAWAGMWLSSAILAPLGAFLTYKSNNDSVALNVDTYINLYKKILGIRLERHLTKKDVIISDPDYSALPDTLRSLANECHNYRIKFQLKKAPNYFTLWTANDGGDELRLLADKIEDVVDEMSNTQSLLLLNAVNKFPIILTDSFGLPFKRKLLNVLCGVILPVGVFFYMRLWLLRVRLDNDLELIVTSCSESENIISNI